MTPFSFARRAGPGRPVRALAAALFVFGFGTELWSPYLPEYLRALGASVFVVGLFGSLQDSLDAALAYPGGALSDRLGSRRALIAFAAASTSGIAIYLLFPSVAAVFCGLLLVTAWRSLALPATFALIGEELPPERRVAGFTVQAVLKRLPIIVASPLGGCLIQRHGAVPGTRQALAISLLLSLATLAALRIALHPGRNPRGRGEPMTPAPQESFRATEVKLHPALKRLLAADCLIRLCEGLPEIFLVVWALEVLRLSPALYGLLPSILTTTAVLSYIPAAALSHRLEKKSLVLMSFLFFALFPVAVVLARSFAQMALACVVGGLREIGEPARKALIVDLAEPAARGRTVGFYYAIRGMAVAGAAGVGGALWTIRPVLPFWTAALLGVAGVAWAAISLPATTGHGEAAA